MKINKKIMSFVLALSLGSSLPSNAINWKKWSFKKWSAKKWFKVGAAATAAATIGTGYKQYTTKHEGARFFWQVSFVGSLFSFLGSTVGYFLYKPVKKMKQQFKKPQKVAKKVVKKFEKVMKTGGEQLAVIEQAGKNFGSDLKDKGMLEKAISIINDIKDPKAIFERAKRGVEGRKARHNYMGKSVTEAERESGFKKITGSGNFGETIYPSSDQPEKIDENHFKEEESVEESSHMLKTLSESTMMVVPN